MRDDPGLQRVENEQGRTFDLCNIFEDRPWESSRVEPYESTNVKKKASCGFFLLFTIIFFDKMGQIFAVKELKGTSHEIPKQWKSRGRNTYQHTNSEPNDIQKVVVERSKVDRPPTIVR